MDGHHQCSNGTRSSYLCRQSSSRWIPTADQIRILRELYYNNGVRSPTAEQIQRISARLRQYGKIEGKNVFYWFQNHKARERQKKKLTMDMPPSNNNTTITHNNDTACMHDTTLGNATNIMPYGVANAASGVYDVGNFYGTSPMYLERSIKESCFSREGGSMVDINNNRNNIGMVGIDPAVPWMYHCIKEEEPMSVTTTREIETLPLFPTHCNDQEQDQEDGQEDKYHCNNDYFTQQTNGGVCLQPAAYYWSTNQSQSQSQGDYHHHYTASDAAASLELTLNSYYYAPPGSM